MSELKSNVIIKNNTIIFSKEILQYFESIKNDNNSKWIDKYFQVLSDISNINAEKYNIHHIRPCFTFKDENHKNRKETKILANNFSLNRINLSVYNHILAHYYLWKIYNNVDSKLTLSRMCEFDKVYDFSETELKEIAKFKEEYAKKNKTKEDYKLWRKQYIDKNKLKIKKRTKEYGLKNKEKIKLSKQKHNRLICFDFIKQERCTLASLQKRKSKYKNLYKNVIIKKCIINYPYDKFIIENENNKKHKQILLKNKKKECNRLYFKNYNKKICFDPIKNENCTYASLSHRKSRNKELYKNINPINYITNIDYDEFMKNKVLNLKKNNKTHQRNIQIKYRQKICFDPIKNNYCTLGALQNRKSRNKELYKNISIKDYIQN